MAVIDRFMAALDTRERAFASLLSSIPIERIDESASDVRSSRNTKSLSLVSPEERCCPFLLALGDGNVAFYLGSGLEIVGWEPFADDPESWARRDFDQFLSSRVERETLLINGDAAEERYAIALYGDRYGKMLRHRRRFVWPWTATTVRTQEYEPWVAQP